MFRQSFFLSLVLFTLFALPLYAKAAHSEWIIHLKKKEDAHHLLSSLNVLEQTGNLVKVSGAADKVNTLHSLPAVQYIEPNKQKQASAVLPYNDPLIFQQWSLLDVHALPALAAYQQKTPNALKGTLLEQTESKQSIVYEEQPLPAESWTIHINKTPLSRLSITLDHVETDWHLKILDEQEQLIGENKGDLMTLDVLLPRDKTFDTFYLEIAGTENWQQQPVIQTLYGTNAIRLAIIDSGISPHEDFCENVLVSAGRDYVEALPYAEDRFGHGTFITGILGACSHNNTGITGIIGNAPVDIIPLKVLDTAGNGDDFDISQAIYDAISMDVDVINMSLAGKGETLMLREAVAEALRRNIVIAAASGNHGTDTGSIYPASYPGVLTVTGTTDQHAPIPMANTGWAVDLSAPGANIISTFKENSYKTMRGTSVAVPYVSGAAALLKVEHPEMDAVSIRHALTQSAHDIGAHGEDTDTGYGLLQLEEARTAAAKQAEAIEWFTLKNGQPLPAASSHLMGFSKNLLGQKAWLFFNDSLQQTWNIVDSIMTVSLPAVTKKANIQVITTGASNHVTASQTINTSGEQPITSTFTDLPASFWAQKDVQQASELGIITGYEDGTFRPNQAVSRRHAAMMLDRFFQWELPAAINTPFKDVSLNTTGFLAISSAYSEQVVKGYKQHFQPNGTVTRAQIALMLSRALKQPQTTNVVHSFEDVPPTHDAYKEIQQLTNLGIFQKTSRFRPYEHVTRAQLCVMLMRADRYLKLLD